MPPLTYIHAIEADRQRDALIAQVSTMIEAMLKMTLMPQKQQAAQTLKTGWDIYKPTAKAALRDESTQVQQWLEYVHAHACGGHPRHPQAFSVKGCKQRI